MTLWHKKKGRRSTNSNRRVKREQKKYEKRLITKGFTTDNNSRPRGLWETNPTNKGRRNTDFYQEVNGIQFFIAPDALYKQMQEEPIEDDYTGFNASWRRETHKDILRKEIQLHEGIKDKRGFLTLEEATSIAPQIKDAVVNSKRTKQPQHVLVTLPEPYTIGQTTTQKTYVEISRLGYVKLPQTGKGLINTYSKTNDPSQIINYSQAPSR